MNRLATIIVGIGVGALVLTRWIVIIQTRDYVLWALLLLTSIIFIILINSVNRI